MSILSQLASSIARLDQRMKAKRREQAGQAPIAPATPVLDVDSLFMLDGRVREAMGQELEALYTSRGLDMTLAALRLGVPKVYLHCIQNGEMTLTAAEYKNWIHELGGDSIAFTAAVNRRLGT